MIDADHATEVICIRATTVDMGKVYINLHLTATRLIFRIGFTLWIVPSATEAKMIEAIMHLRPEGSNGTDATSYAKFYPHITLAAQLPTTMEDNPDVLRSLIPLQDAPLTCSFASIDIGDAYFRSVYVAIKPSFQLLDLHKKVHENLQIETRTPIFPHLSLVYIADADGSKERRRYYDLLEKGRKVKINDTGEAVGVSLNFGSEAEEYWVDHFDAREVWAVKCDGPAESWEVKAKYPLVSPNT